MQTIVKLPPTSASEPSTADLDGWVVTEGTPSMKTWVLHTSAAGDMISGIWECTVGSYHATYTAYEYVVLIAGRITITPDGGTPVTVTRGRRLRRRAHIQRHLEDRGERAQALRLPRSPDAYSVTFGASGLISSVSIRIATSSPTPKGMSGPGMPIEIP